MKKSFTFFVFVLTLFTQPSLNAQLWEEQAIGVLQNDYGVFDISIVDENVVWAVAFDQTITNPIPSNHSPHVIKTVDGGLTWERYDIEEASGTISFDIEAVDAETAFITTNDYGNGSGRNVFKTEDGGETWNSKLENTACGVWIRFFNELDGVVINRQSMATTEDGGETWQLVSLSNVPAFQTNEFTIISSGNNSCQVVDDHVWFGTNRGRIFRSKDKGHSWEVVNTSLGNNALILSVAFKDSLTGLAIDANSFNTSFAETSDGGDTWNNISSNPGISISNIEYVPGTDSVLIGGSDIFVSSSQRVSVVSVDFGKNWATINNNIPYGGIEFTAPDIGWTSRGIVSFFNQPAMYKWDSDIFVSTSETELHDAYEVYPNPFQNDIFVSNSNNIKGYRLLHGNGTIIKSEKFDALPENLNFQNLDFGMYLLQFITDKDDVITKRIFKVN